MIKPTVGRVVWYQPNDRDAKSLGAGDQPLAAHVAYVHSDTIVNLMVIDPNGNPHSRTSVRLVQAGGSPAVGESFCEWMPYQVGQAAKHAAEEKPAAVSDGFFGRYRRKQIAELRPFVPGESLNGVSISPEDHKAGSPKVGDMIARNPKNHKDQWLVAAAYFADNFERV